MWSQAVEWAQDSAAAAVQDVAVNHGNFSVSVPQEFLDGADIVAAFEQFRCEGMSKRVACRVFWNPGLSGRLFHRLLDYGFVEMMPTFNIGSVIEVPARRWEDPLPTPFTRRIGVFPFQCG